MSLDSIDAVITWVDGGDPKWQQKYLQHLSLQTHALTDSHSLRRFRNHGEIKYVIRSIQDNMPWIRRIFLVSDSQLPSFLTKDNSQLRIVPHQEIIDPSFLPTFSSMTIEAHLCEISDLSEKFIYFNDDIFVRKPVSPFEFFEGELPIIYLDTKEESPRGQIIDSDISYFAAWKNANRILDQWEGHAQTRRVVPHMPTPHRKSFCQEVNSLIQEELLSSMQNKFRSTKSLPVTNALYPYFYKIFKNAPVRHQDSLAVSISSDLPENERIFLNILECSSKFFCIQDDYEVHLPDVSMQIERFLKTVFPRPSKLEKRPLLRLPNLW